MQVGVAQDQRWKAAAVCLLTVILQHTERSESSAGYSELLQGMPCVAALSLCGSQCSCATCLESATHLVQALIYSIHASFEFSQPVWRTCFPAAHNVCLGYRLEVPANARIDIGNNVLTKP